MPPVFRRHAGVRLPETVFAITSKLTRVYAGKTLCNSRDGKAEIAIVALSSVHGNSSPQSLSEIFPMLVARTLLSARPQKTDKVASLCHPERSLDSPERIQRSRRTPYPQMLSAAGQGILSD